MSATRAPMAAASAAHIKPAVPAPMTTKWYRLLDSGFTQKAGRDIVEQA